MSDHLIPHDNPLETIPLIANYHSHLAAVLTPKYPPKSIVHATIYCLPSFEPEWSVHIVRHPSSHLTAMACTATKNHWMEELSTSDDIERNEIDIPLQVGERLIRLFGFLLAETRFSKSLAGGLDGVRYYFSSGHMSGMTWSPPDNSRMDRLCKLAEALHSYILNSRPIDGQISKQVDWFYVNTLGLT